MKCPGVGGGVARVFPLTCPDKPPSCQDKEHSRKKRRKAKRDDLEGKILRISCGWVGGGVVRIFYSALFCFFFDSWRQAQFTISGEAPKWRTWQKKQIEIRRIAQTTTKLPWRRPNYLFVCHLGWNRHFYSPILIFSYSWSSFPGLIFQVLCPPDFRFQISDLGFQISEFIFEISYSYIRFKISDFIFQMSYFWFFKSWLLNLCWQFGYWQFRFASSTKELYLNN